MINASTFGKTAASVVLGSTPHMVFLSIQTAHCRGSSQSPINGGQGNVHVRFAATHVHTCRSRLKSLLCRASMLQRHRDTGIAICYILGICEQRLSIVGYRECAELEVFHHGIVYELFWERWSVHGVKFAASKL